MVSPFGLSGAAQAGALESYGKIYIYIYPVDFSINLNTALGELNLNNQVADSGVWYYITLCQVGDGSCYRQHATLASMYVFLSQSSWTRVISFHLHLHAF